MTAVSALDDQTTDAIRQALAEAGAGRLESACEIGEQALKAGGDAPALHAMLGMLFCRTGQFKAAIEHLRAAHDARPSDVTIAMNLVVALIELGQAAEALEVATRELADTDRTMQMARYRGYAGQLAGQYDTAISAYRTVVEAVPDDWQSWNNLGSAYLSDGDAAKALGAFQQSRDLNPAFLGTWLNLARAAASASQMDEAEAVLRSAAEQFPNAAQPLRQLHELLRRRGRPSEELRPILEQAAERAPDDKEVLLAVGQQRMIADDVEGAELAFRRVLAADSRDPEAFVELAKLYEHKNPALLESLVHEANDVGLDPPALFLIQAFAYRRSRQFAEALAALDQVSADFEPWLANDIRGQCFDKLGQADAAFTAFTRMNEAQAAEPYDAVARAAQLRAAMTGRLDLLTPEWIDSWTDESAPDDRPSPTFLVGFPRSGTTLLDTILMGHEDVAVMEELPALDAVARQLGGFKKIPALTDAEVRDLRTTYFEVAGRSVDLGRPVLIDKNPLHLPRMPLILRLFPDARFILSLRHPADVVLSCYFSNFRLTPTLGNFLRLDTTAEFYDLMFRMWERGRNLMKPEVHTIRYERLVEDPEAEVRPIIDALGLKWNDAMLDHQATASSRGTVPTASYAQVTEPLYRSSVDRWKQYREQLEPVLPILRPWIDKFGYAV